LKKARKEILFAVRHDLFHSPPSPNIIVGLNNNTDAIPNIYIVNAPAKIGIAIAYAPKID
jgi:hypothetical protein